MAIESNAEGLRHRWLVGLLLVVSGIFYAVGFLHLRADFPNGSPWMDWSWMDWSKMGWSQMAREGWCGGAAIHHFVQGSWYLPDSFNPVVAMPVWPAMLGVWFAVTGMSMLAARTLTMLLYGVSLVLLYRVVWRARPGRLAAVVVLLTVVNPFCYEFDRLALLGPVTVFWMMLALWLGGETKREDWARQLLLGVVIGLLVLTHGMGIALVPAVIYLLCARWGWRESWWRGGAAVALVAGTAAVLWLGYMRLVVRPQYLADYRLLAGIHAYLVPWSIAPKMAGMALRDGLWISPVLFPLAVVVCVLSVVWLRELWRVPLFGAAVIAMVGCLGYIGYHASFEPRFYVVMAMPMMMVIGLSYAARERLCSRKTTRWAGAAVIGMVVIAAVGMAVHTVEYVAHPEYSFWESAEGIAAIMQADGGARPVLLSDSGDDITLWTGVPAVALSYTTHGTDAMLNRYQPGWYATWLGHEDNGIQRVRERYRLNEVAHYEVFDDATRETLVLYKLTPR